MRVLNVNHTLDPVNGGGTAERTLQMSRFLVRSGIECTVLTTEEGFDSGSGARLAGAHVVAVPLLSRRFFVPRVAPRLMGELVAAADIVHLMGHWSPLNALVYRAARHLRKPYVVCPAGALRIYGRSRLLKRLYNLAVGTGIVRDASMCIAITSDEIGQFAQYGVGRDRIRIIPNGIDPAAFARADPAAFRASFGLGAHPFVLFVGRLNPIKGPDLLLEAFCSVKSALADFHMVFAGPDGGMLEALRETARVEGVADRVHFIGYIGGTDKTSAYHAASLLAIPSRQEAMSIVALEAGITETPVLLTNRCGFDVIDGGGGKVVPATAEGIAAGLAALLGTPATLPAMGRALGEFTRGHYLWESVVRDYIALYCELIEGGPLCVS